MPTNEQRRETAKRKLERQLERRAAQERRRRLFTIIGSARGRAPRHRRRRRDGDPDQQGLRHQRPRPTPPPPTTRAAPSRRRRRVARGLPPFVAPADLGADCQYPALAGEPASKKNNPPRSGKVPTEPAQISASMTTSQGNIGLQLDNAKAPCTVNSFASLAQQGYFNDTPCHRLTTSPGLSVLQCGDPTGKGTGGPGYGFVNEYPTNQYQPDDPALQSPVVYPRGTLAMANTGAPDPTAASSSSCSRIRSCRRTTPRSARSTRRVWPRSTRSPRAASCPVIAEPTTAHRRRPSKSSRSNWTDAGPGRPP